MEDEQCSEEIIDNRNITRNTEIQLYIFYSRLHCGVVMPYNAKGGFINLYLPKNCEDDCDLMI